MKTRCWMASLLAAFVAFAAPRAHAIRTPMPDPSAAIASPPQCAALSVAATSLPPSASLDAGLEIVSIEPIGYAADGDCLDLVCLVERETHNAVFCIVKSPLGLATRAQYQHIVNTAMRIYGRTGNRTALGRAAEAVLEQVLERSGHVIVKGPVNRPGAHNADIVAFDPKSGRVLIIDNKVQRFKKTVSRANSVTTDLGRRRSIDDAIRHLQDMEISASLRKRIRKALTAQDPQWIVANASPRAIKNLVCDVSSRLKLKGVLLGEIIEGSFAIKSSDEAIQQAVKTGASRLAKAAPAIGLVASGLINAPRVRAAYIEDQIYEQQIRAMGAEPTYAGASMERVLSVIAAEEATGEYGAALGALIGSPFGGWGAIPGALIGGLGGDALGGWTTESAFDDMDFMPMPNYNDPRVKDTREQAAPYQLYWNPDF